MVDFAFKGGNPGFPVRAPPILQRGGFSLCGTNVSSFSSVGGVKSSSQLEKSVTVPAASVKLS